MVQNHMSRELPHSGKATPQCRIKNLTILKKYLTRHAGLDPASRALLND